MVGHGGRGSGVEGMGNSGETFVERFHARWGETDTGAILGLSNRGDGDPSADVSNMENSCKDFGCTKLSMPKTSFSCLSLFSTMVLFTLISNPSAVHWTIILPAHTSKSQDG